MTGPGPCIVGLTGGLATGKSTVAKLARARGIPVLDADAVVHRLYEPGEAGTEFVVELFGRDVLSPEGAVDRRALRARVVGDREARQKLNAAIHPLVRSQIAAWLDTLTAPVAVVEAALLVETGAYRMYDVVVVVWCKPEQQIRRAVERGLPEAAARALLAAQTSVDDKLEVADVAIDNRGPASELEGEFERGWAEVLKLCRPS